MAEGGSGDDVACPPSFLDPVTYEIMHDPVFTANDGQTFERATIEQWLQTHDTSPLHGGRLEDTRLVPNIALRKSIEEWRTKHHKIIPMSAIVIGAQIGRGSFKVVHRGTLSLPGARAPTEVAVLRVRTTDVAAEAGTLLQLGQHPRLVRFFGQCEDGLDTLLITECVTLHYTTLHYTTHTHTHTHTHTECENGLGMLLLAEYVARCHASTLAGHALTSLRRHRSTCARNAPCTTAFVRFAECCTLFTICILQLRIHMLCVPPTTVANPAVSFARPCSQ
jgi:hypothetical protein